MDFSAEYHHTEASLDATKTFYSLEKFHTKDIDYFVLY